MSFNPLNLRSDNARETAQNWYQTKTWLLIFSLLIATAIVWATWQWDEVLSKETKSFWIAVEVDIQNTSSSDGGKHTIYSVEKYDEQDIDDVNPVTCGINRNDKTGWVSVEVEGSTRQVQRLEERCRAWKPIRIKVDAENLRLPVDSDPAEPIGDDEAKSDRSKDPARSATKTKNSADKTTESGKNSVVIASDDIKRVDKLFNKVDIKNIKGKKVTYIVETLEERDLSINAVFEGEFPPHIRYAKISVKPERVTVRVQPSLTKDQTIRTEPIERSAISQTDTITKNLILKPGVSLIDDSHSQVEVTVEVIETDVIALLAPAKLRTKGKAPRGETAFITPEYVSVLAHVRARGSAGPNTDKDDVTASEEGSEWKRRSDDCIDALRKAEIKAYVTIPSDASADLSESLQVELESRTSCKNIDIVLEPMPTEVHLRFEDASGKKP